MIKTCCNIYCWHNFNFLDVKKLAAVIVKQWMSLVRNQSGISGNNNYTVYVLRCNLIMHGLKILKDVELLLL